MDPDLFEIQTDLGKKVPTFIKTTNFKRETDQNKPQELSSQIKILDLPVSVGGLSKDNDNYS